MKRLVFLCLATFMLGVPSAIATPPVTCNGVDVTDLRATDEPDFLTGTDDPDVIALGQGGDQYFGGVGPASDIICGGVGPDVVVGEDGDDYLDGEPGDDIVAGLNGDDVVRGGFGDDTLKGGSGQDVIRSATGDGQRDDLYDGPGSDEVIGQPEDVWHRCGDDAADLHADFLGNIVPEPDCDFV